MTLLSTFQELDSYLDDVENSGDDGHMRASWAELRIDPGLWGKFPARLRELDPFSPEYEVTVREFFRYIQGEEYSLANEGFAVDIDYMCAVGYPYTTRSPSTVGNFLIAYGYIIRTMGLPVPSKILDIGSGAGSLTIHLAKMGYEMTCIDANSDFVELIKKMTQELPNKIDCICGDMGKIELLQEYDAILFMESFHHSLNHRGTLAHLRRFLKKDGSFIFASEPVLLESYDAVPYPWGPRLDGESIRSIRKFGWIELGFSSEYFDRILLEIGFSSKRYRSPESWWADVIIAHPLVVLEKNHRIEFSTGSKGIKTLCSGWSDPEEFGTWSCDNNANIRFSLKSSFAQRSVRIQLAFLIFLAPNHTEQGLELMVNGQNVGLWRFQGETLRAAEISFLAPEPVGEFNAMDIHFHFLSPVSPKELRVSEDTRRLGLALKSIQLNSM